MSTGEVRSTRRKTMPLSAGAGLSVMRTFWPVCSPTPEALTRDFRVRWRNMRAADCNGQPSGHPGKEGCPDSQEGLVGLLAQKSRGVVLVDARLLQRFDRRSAAAVGRRQVRHPGFFAPAGRLGPPGCRDIPPCRDVPTVVRYNPLLACFANAL